MSARPLAPGPPDGPDDEADAVADAVGAVPAQAIGRGLGGDGRNVGEEVSEGDPISCLLLVVCICLHKKSGDFPAQALVFCFSFSSSRLLTSAMTYQ